MSTVTVEATGADIEALRKNARKLAAPFWSVPPDQVKLGGIYARPLVMAGTGDAVLIWSADVECTVAEQPDRPEPF